MADSKCLLIGPFAGWDPLERGARERGWTVLKVESGAEAFRVLGRDPAIVAVVLPLALQDGPADNLLLRARAAGTRADFVVLAPPDRISERGSLLAEGAEEILDEPVDGDRVLRKLELLRDRRRLIDDLGMIVRDPVMLELFERILRVAPLKVTTLITGESGTGKEMLAQAIHRASDRRAKPFVPVNVGALPENLVESELFGHERGAFTSADARRIGRFEMADGGTLFLDEIGEMPLAAQVNLLRVLEEERFLRVGGSTPVSVDVRIVAATNRDLDDLVQAGRFRRDLYYRLKVVELDVPPLRQRRAEIPVLAKELALRAAAKHGIAFPGFTKDAIEALADYEWPGNVRELRNLVDGLVALRPETPVRASDLPAHLLHGPASGAARPLPAIPSDRAQGEREFIIQSLLAIRADMGAIKELLLSGAAGRAAAAAARSGFGAPSGEPVYPARPVRVEESDESLSLSEMERRAVERALRESGGNRRLAAKTLGISERTLYRRIKDFGMTA
ncbi:MAG: sigma-54 dependent transcriptional regulator [bacterium]